MEGVEMTAIIESLLRIFQWAIIIFTGSFISTILFNRDEYGCVCDVPSIVLNAKQPEV